jgi:hypothetical protein
MKTDLPIAGTPAMIEKRSEPVKPEETSSSFIPHPSSFREAWEQIENGRYMPRRIRGSCVGRELG